MYLLDTDVLSSLRAKRRDPRVVRWLDSKRSSDLHLSVVSIAEIECQIKRESESDDGAAHELAAWLDRLVNLHRGCIIDVDLGIAKHWGRLSTEVGYEGADLLVAATALERGLTVVTLNAARFRPTGVQTIDPSAVTVVI